nr:putative wax ester synthase/acyl-CoA:diacylglycerol acyltransferase [uncultured bacterium]
MKQLGPLDSAFINLENNTTPQHVGGLGIYDPSTAPNGTVRFKSVLDNFETRFQAMPIFRTRLVRVPGQIDRPYWVVDQNFDVEFHLRHIALPEPGDWRQLWIQVARLHSRSLDLSRPLWEAYVIEGLDNLPDIPKGAFAIYTKMHHSLVDGAGGQGFMTAIHDLEPNPRPSSATAETLIVDRQPSPTELLSRALVNRVKNTVTLSTGFLKKAREMAEYRRSVKKGEIPSASIQAPRTRFNEMVGPHRVADAAVFSLDDFKAIKNAAGVTLNDVAVSVVGGGLRKYLQYYNELPETSLAAGIPMDMHTRRAATDENNQIASMVAPIHTDIGDPMARLKAVHESMNIAKQSNATNPMVDSLRIAGVFSPVLSQAVARFYVRNKLSKRLPVSICGVITNVAGPNFAMYSAGAKLIRNYGLGLLTPGSGLFHSIYSFDGMVTLTVLGDRDQMPDPEFYRQCLETAFVETKAAALGSPQRAAAKPNVRKAKAVVNKKSTTPANKKRTTTSKRTAGKKAAAKA